MSSFSFKSAAAASTDEDLPPGPRSSGALPVLGVPDSGAATSLSALVSANTVLPADALVDPLSSPDAEFEVCGWLLRMTHEEVSTAQRFMDQVRDQDIAYPIYRNIICAARTLVIKNEVAGATAILDYGVLNKLDMGGADHLGQLVADPIGAVFDRGRLEQDIEIILEYSGRRKVRRILEDRLADLPLRPVSEIISVLSDDVIALQSDAHVLRSEPEHISESMTKLMEDITMETEPKNIIPMGFRDLDEKLGGGPRNGELIIIAGRPSMGKTAFAMGVARNISLSPAHRRPVLVFSMEMGAKSLASRALSAESGVPAKYLRTNEVDDVLMGHIMDVLPRFAGPDGTNTYTSARLWIDDTPGLGLSDIRSRSRQFVREYARTCAPGDESPIIIVDYLQIMEKSPAGRGGDETQANLVGKNSAGLKSLARELDTPVLVLAQLNRGLEQRTNKIPIMSDLRDSGNIEQDADVILFVYRDVVYNADTEDPNEALIIVAKQRDGEKGPVSLNFNDALVRFEDRSYANKSASMNGIPSSTAPSTAPSYHEVDRGADGESEDWTGEVNSRY